MRVGVILAARAPVPYLDEALRSVFAQEPAPDEVVLVDHASSPPLPAVDGVRLVRVDDADGGPARARDAGLAVLETEWVALIDADDVWEPRKLGAQLAAVADAPGAAACFGRAVVVDAVGRETGEQLPELEAGVHEADALSSRLFAANAIPASSALIRRDALEAVGGFEPAVALPAATDWDLWLRLVTAGCSFVCEPDARIRYRRHDGGLTSSVSRLAAAGLEIHKRHAALVDEATAREAQARDLEALARGLIRERRYTEARAALDEAAALAPQAQRERALRAAVAIPGVRTLLGRRNPYR